jgi:hypothetical protein
VSIAGNVASVKLIDKPAAGSTCRVVVAGTGPQAVLGATPSGNGWSALGGGRDYTTFVAL